MGVGKVSESQEIRPAALLSDAYVATTSFDVSRANAANILVFYTKGNATSMQMVIEYSGNTVGVSDSNSVWYRSIDPSTGVDRIFSWITSGNRMVEMPEGSNWMSAQKMRVLVKGTGTTSATSVEVSYIRRNG